MTTYSLLFSTKCDPKVTSAAGSKISETVRRDLLTEARMIMLRVDTDYLSGKFSDAGIDRIESFTATEDHDFDAEDKTLLCLRIGLNASSLAEAVGKAAPVVQEAYRHTFDDASGFVRTSDEIKILQSHAADNGLDIQFHPEIFKLTDAREGDRQLAPESAIARGSLQLINSLLPS